MRGSAAFNNAMFLVRSNYLELMNDIYKVENYESASLLANQDQSAIESTNSKFYTEKNQQFTFYGTLPVESEASLASSKKEQLTLN